MEPTSHCSGLHNYPFSAEYGASLLLFPPRSLAPTLPVSSCTPSRSLRSLSGTCPNNSPNVKYKSCGQCSFFISRSAYLELAETQGDHGHFQGHFQERFQTSFSSTKVEPSLQCHRLFCLVTCIDTCCVL